MLPTIILFIALMCTWTSLRMCLDVSKEGYDDYQVIGTWVFNAITACLWSYFYYLTH